MISNDRGSADSAMCMGFFVASTSYAVNSYSDDGLAGC